MKKIVLLIVNCIWTILSFGQNLLEMPAELPFDVDNKLIVYNKVIELPGLNSSDLISIGKKYYIEKMGGKVKDIDIEDKENSKFK